LIEPARLRPHSSMPPWRGEGMTGTRALGLPTASGCWWWSCSPPRHLPEGGHRPGNRFSSASILRQPFTAPRSFVLAALRALHRW